MLKTTVRIIAILIALLVLLLIAYKILSSIPDYEIDASTVIIQPQSAKSKLLLPGKRFLTVVIKQFCWLYLKPQYSYGIAVLLG